MGTVKYTGPVASFHCPTNAEIRSLKVHFSPKQEGTGDPSPENVREIVGWDGVEAYKSGKNMAHIVGYSATSISSPSASRPLTNTYGTSINTNVFSLPDTPLIITQSQAPRTTDIPHYQNGYVFIVLDNIAFNQRYDISFKVTNIINNPLQATLNQIRIINPYGNQMSATEVNGDILIFRNIPYVPNNNIQGFDIRICGMSCTISNIIITPSNTFDNVYEPYQGSITNYEFGVLGKNKFDASAVVQRDGHILQDDGTARSSTISGYTQNLTPVFSNTQYTISGTIIPTSGSWARIYFYDGQENWISRSAEIDYASIPYTFTTPNNCKFIAIQYNYETVQFDTIQLELGSTATAYEPYNPNHTVYGGWVDLISGEVCEKYTKIDLGEINWIYYAYGNYGGGYSNTYTSIIKSYKSDETPNAYCSNLKTRSDTAFNLQNSGYDITINIYKSIKVTYNSVTDATTLKSALSGIMLICELATPITYHLAPTQLQTFLGQNNVWSNADYVEVEYDLHETQDILVRKQFIMANQPHIITPAAAPLQNFVTDVPAPLKECKVYFEPKQDLHGYDKPWIGGSGKNILNTIDSTPRSGSYSISISDGMVTVSAVGGGNSTLQWFNQIFSADTYTISAKYSGAVSGVRFLCDKAIDNWTWNDYYNAYFSPTNNTATFTASEDFSIGIVFLTLSGHTGESGSIYDIQLEKGSTATSYEPYENVCPISGQSELMMKRAGKNLFDSWATGYYSPSAGRWLAESQNTNCKPLKMRAGTIVTLSQRNTGRDFSFEEWKNYPSSTSDCVAANLFTRASNATGATQTYTVQNDCWLTARVNIGVDATTETFANAQIQLELGSNNTEYESYNGTTISITFPTEAGTVYGGYVDLVNGEVVAKWGSFDLGSLPWTTRNNGSIYYFSATLPDNITSNMWTPNAASSLNNYPPHFMSDRFTIVSGSSIHSGTSSDNTIGMDWFRTVRLKCDMYEYDANVFKAAMDGVTVLYELATPITYSIDPITLKTLRGTNNVWSNANGNIDLSYWKH